MGLLEGTKRHLVWGKIIIQTSGGFDSERLRERRMERWGSAQMGLCLSELWAALVFIHKISRADRGWAKETQNIQQKTHTNLSSHRARGRSTLSFENIISHNKPKKMILQQCSILVFTVFTVMNLQQLNQVFASIWTKQFHKLHFKLVHHLSNPLHAGHTSTNMQHQIHHHENPSYTLHCLNLLEVY